MVHKINSNPSSIQPSQNPDRTLSAYITGSVRSFGNERILPVLLPGDLIQGSIFAAYFLLRCGARVRQEREQNWQYYWRRTLFAVSRDANPSDTDATRRDEWQLLLPSGDDPGIRWLIEQPVGTMLNLLGPFGHNLELPTHCRNLLLIAEPHRMPLLLPLITEMLDRGGRVALLMGKHSDTKSLVAQLPIAVEVQTAADEKTFFDQLADLAPWCDTLVGAVPLTVCQRIAGIIRSRRFVLEPGFAHILVEADLLCGFGACLACVVPLGNDSLTRSCIHGPVFDLTALTRKP